MVSQSDFPDSWSCDSDSKHVKVEVQIYDDVYEAVYNRDENPASEAVDISVDTDNYTYIEIPTLEVQQIISTTENGGRKRTAEVFFPDTWDTIDDGSKAILRPLIVGYASSVSGAAFAKVSLRDSVDDPWRLKHHGYIGGVGGTETNGELRMWVHDVSELLKSKRANKTFNGAIAEDVYGFMTDEASELMPLVATQTLPYEASQTLLRRIEASLQGQFRDYYFFQTFSSNRDSLYDVFTWFTEQTGLSWEFLPQPDGVALEVFDDSAIERETLSQFYDEITVIQNTSLNTINPYNAVSVKGATTNSAEVSPNQAEMGGETTGQTIQSMLGIDVQGVNDVYPTAEAYIPELVESASGTRLYAEQNAEIDAETLEQAENTAKQRLLNALNDTTEGEIRLDGNTRVTLYSNLIAEETCSGVAFPDTAPVSYQVENIRHICSVRDGKPFRTNCQVSVAIDEADIEIESEMVNVDD